MPGCTDTNLTLEYLRTFWRDPDFNTSIVNLTQMDVEIFGVDKLNEDPNTWKYGFIRDTYYGNISVCSSAHTVALPDDRYEHYTVTPSNFSNVL